MPVRKLQESTFIRHLERLRQFQKTTPLDSFGLTQTNQGIYMIIRRYRLLKKEGDLKEEHEKELIKIGFPFEAESVFERHMKRLREIKRTTPLRSICRKNNREIYEGIIRLYRILKKKGNLKKEHEKELIEIGFPFESFDRLIQYNKKPSFRNLQELKKRIEGKKELTNNDEIVMQKVSYFISHYEKEAPYVFDKGNILIGKDNFRSIPHQDLVLFQTFIKNNAHYEMKHWSQSAKIGDPISFIWCRGENTDYQIYLGYARNPNDRPQRKAEMMVFKRCVDEMKVEPSKNEIVDMAYSLGMRTIVTASQLKRTGVSVSDDVTVFEEEDDDKNEEATVACSVVADLDIYDRLLHCDLDEETDGDLDDLDDDNNDLDEETDGDLDDDDKTDGDVPMEMPHDLQKYIQEVTNDVNLVLNKTVEHTNFSIDGTVPPLPLTAEEVDHLHGKAIGTVRKTEHLLEQWKVSSYAHALSTGRETVEYPGVPVEEKVLSPPLTLEEVNGVYDRAIETIKKNEHLLTEWKASWDTQEVDYPGV